MANKAVEITLSDGREIVVREPLTAQLGLFIRAMPALQAFAKLGDITKSDDGGLSAIAVVLPEIPEAHMDALYGLLASMAGLDVSELKTLPLWDGLAVMTSLGVLVPANFTRQTKSISSAG